QLIAEDADPAVSAVLREHRSALPQSWGAIAGALDLIDELESDGPPAAAAGVQHYCEHGLMAALESWRIHPQPGITDTSGVEIRPDLGVALPGERAVVAITATCGGGKRWHCDVEYSGIEIVRSEALDRGGLRLIGYATPE